MMKKFSSKILLMATAVVMLFAACDSEDVENPLGNDNGPEVTVTVTPDEDVYAEGSSIDVSINFSGANEVVGATLVAETATAFYNLSDADGITFDSNSGSNVLDLNEFGVAGESSGTISLNGLIIPSDLEGADFTLTAELEDAEGNVGDGTVTFATEIALNTYSAILLTAPQQDTTQTPVSATRTSKTFFSTTTGLRYSMVDVNSTSDPISADIDFAYYYGSSNNASLVAPDDFPFAYGQSAWGTRNATVLKKTSLTASEFNEANIATVNTAFDDNQAGSTDGLVANLAIGDVIAFETDSDKEGGSKRGLILVDGLTPGAGSNGQIELTIIVQD